MDDQRWFLANRTRVSATTSGRRAIEDAHRRDLEEAFADSDAA